MVDILRRNITLWIICKDSDGESLTCGSWSDPPANLSYPPKLFHIIFKKYFYSYHIEHFLFVTPTILTSSHFLTVSTVSPYFLSHMVSLIRVSAIEVSNLATHLYLKKI